MGLTLIFWVHLRPTAHMSWRLPQAPLQCRLPPPYSTCPCTATRWRRMARRTRCPWPAAAAPTRASAGSSAGSCSPCGTAPASPHAVGRHTAQAPPAAPRTRQALPGAPPGTSAPKATTGTQSCPCLNAIALPAVPPTARAPRWQTFVWHLVLLEVLVAPVHLAPGQLVALHSGGGRAHRISGTATKGDTPRPA